VYNIDGCGAIHASLFIWGHSAIIVRRADYALFYNTEFMKDLYLTLIGGLIFVLVAYIRADPRKKE